MCPSFSIEIHLEGHVENDVFSFTNLFLLYSVKSSINILSKLSRDSGTYYLIVWLAKIIALSQIHHRKKLGSECS